MAAEMEQMSATSDVEVFRKGDELIEGDDWSKVVKDYSLTTGEDMIISIEGTKEEILGFLDRARKAIEAA